MNSLSRNPLAVPGTSVPRVNFVTILSSQLTVFSSVDSVPRPQGIMHIKRTRHTQFYAPTEASIKEF